MGLLNTSSSAPISAKYGATISGVTSSIRDGDHRGLRSLSMTAARTPSQKSSLEQCLVREYRAALEVFASDDFREGVRAAVIDKDRNPRWSPARIADVTPEIVARYFAEIGADELVFDKTK